MPNVLNSFQNRSDDTAYSNWLVNHTPAICKDVAQGNESLERVTAFVTRHFKSAAVSVQSLQADINLLQQAIVARQIYEVSERGSRPSLKGVWTQSMRSLRRSDSSIAKARKALQELELLQRERLRMLSDNAVSADLLATPENASLGFALMNVFMNLDTTDLSFTVTYGLSLMITALKTYRHRLPNSAQPQVDTLLQKFENVYRIESLVSNQKTDVSNYHIADGLLQSTLLQKLEQGQSLYLSSGWSASPAGHQITLELTPRRAADHRIMISGRIQNRGAGLSHHEITVKGLKTVYDPELTLTEVPLQDLAKSPFLSTWLALNYQVRPCDTQIPAGMDCDTATAFSQKDFYDVFLPTWPAFIRYSEQPKFQLDQRSGNCAIKPFLTEMRDVLGEEDSELIRYWFTLDCWTAFVSQIGVTEENVDQLEPLLDKLALRTIKMKNHGLHSILQDSIPSAQELDAVIDFCASARTWIDATRSARTTRILQETLPFSTPIVESGALSIAIPTIEPLPTDHLPVTHTLTPADEIPSPQDPEKWLLFHLQQARLAESKNALVEAKNICLHALRELPNPSDNIWDGVQSPVILNSLPQMIEILANAGVQANRQLIISPQQYCFWFKAFGVCYRLAKNASSETIYDDLAGIMRGTTRNFRGKPTMFAPLDPVATQAYHDTLNVLSRAFPCSWWSFKRRDDLLSYEQNVYFSSLEELPECQVAYLHAIASAHRPLWSAAAVVMLGDDVTPEMMALTGIMLAHKASSLQARAFAAMIPLEYRALTHILNYCVLAVSGAQVSHNQGKIAVVPDGEISDLSVKLRVKFGDVNAAASEALGRENHSLFLQSFADDLGEADTQLIQTIGGTERGRLSQEMQSVVLKSLSFDPLELQDFWVISHTNGLVIPQLVHFFRKRISLLNSPAIQRLILITLFQASILDQNALGEALDQMPQSQEIRILFTFFSQSLKKMQRVKSWSSYGFMLRLYAISLSHWAQHATASSSPLMNDFIVDFQKKLGQLQKVIPSINPHEQAGLATHVLSMIPYLNGSPILASLARDCLTLRNALGGVAAGPGFHTDFHLKEDVERAVFHLRASGVDLGHTGQLPSAIADHDHYKKVFSMNYAAQELSQGLYAFTDHLGVSYRIAVDPQGALRLLRQFPEHGATGWYALQVDEPSANDFVDSPLAKNGFFNIDTLRWIKAGAPPELLFTKRNGDLLSRVTDQGMMHPTDPSLTLLANYEIPLIHALARLTSKTQIVAWKDRNSGALKKVELKEFQMHFDAQADGNGQVRWMCSRYPGFYLDDHCQHTDFEPFKHYVVLRNRAGERQVIVPSKHFMPLRGKFGRLPNPVVEGDTLHRLFAYDVPPDGILRMPKDPLSAQYLLHLALQKHDYNLGNRVIQVMKRHREPWDQSMLTLLQYFVVPPGQSKKEFDGHPRAVALRLQLMALRLDQTQGALKTQESDQLTDDYLEYLNQLSNIPAKQRLSVEEERRVNRQAVDMSAAAQHIVGQRRRQLQGNWDAEPYVATDQSAFREPKLLNVPTQWTWLTPEMQQEMVSAMTAPRAIHFPLRPGAGFLHNFLYYYNILQQRSPPEAVNEVMTVCRLCRYDPDWRIQSVRGMLLSIAENNGPPVEELLPDLLPALANTFNQRPKVQEVGFYEKLQTPPARAPALLAAPAALQPTRPAEHDTLPLTFQNIPDTLISTLLAQGAVSDSVPSSADDGRLQDELHHLRDIERFYQARVTKSSDPAMAREFGRLLQGVQQIIHRTDTALAAMQFADSGQCIVSLNDPTLDEMIVSLSERCETEQRELDSAEQQLTAMLNDYPSPRLHMERQAGLLSPLSLQDALVHFGRGDDLPFYQANPGLQPAQLLELKQTIGRYLMHKLNAQKTTRLLKALQVARSQQATHGVASAQYQAAKAYALKTLQAKRIYEPCQAPHLLVYEAFADICLRADQLRALEQLSNESTDDNLILEARTGFGKSKTVIPLWLYLTAARRRNEETPGVAMMTVLPALFPQQVSHLKDVLGGSFQQIVYAFRFDRTKGNDLAFLQNLNRQFDRAAAEGTCNLTTVGSLHGLLILKIQELLAKPANPADDQLLQELRILRYKAKQRLSNFFDESRECFDVRIYHDYAIGSPQPPQPSHCQAVQNLYEILLTQQIPFDFMHEPQPSHAAALTEKSYHADVKPTLVKSLLGRLIPTTFPEPADACHLLDQLLMGHYDPAVADYLTTLTPAQVDLLAIYCDQLNVYLPRTLTRPCNGRYGLAVGKTGNRLACPFERGVPKLSSQFATFDDLINFTIQANLKTPFPLQTIDQWLQGLKLRFFESANKEKFTAEDADYRLYLVLTRSIPNWPADLLSCRSSDVQRLHHEINSHPTLKVKFIVSQVLPTIGIYAEKVSSSAHNIAEVIHKIYGASATVNTDTLSPRLVTVEDPGALVGSLLALWKHSRQAIFRVDQTDAVELLQSILAQQLDHRAIIDVAGLFRDLRDDRQIAELIFKQTRLAILPVNAVSYYDEDGGNRVFLRPKDGEPLSESVLRKDCPCENENVFVFIRQNSAVGADTPMAMTLKALVTVDGATQRDLFFQGVGRCREIEFGQRVGLLMRKCDSGAFTDQHGRVTLEKILAVVSLNQAVQRGEDLVFNLRLLLQNLMAKQFWDYFDQQSYSLAQCRQQFQSLRGFFVESTKTASMDSLKQLRGVVPIADAVEQIKRSFENKIAPMINVSNAQIFDLKAVMAKFERLIDYSKLPALVNMISTSDSNREVEAEADEEADVADSDEQADRDRSRTTQVPDTASGLGSSNKSFYYTELDSDPSRQTGYPFGKFASLFSPLMVNSPSFQYYIYGGNGGEMQTAYEYMVIDDNGTYKVVLMDRHDASVTSYQMKHIPTQRDYFLMSAGDDLVMQNTSDPNRTFDRERWERNPQVTLMTKIFVRNWAFTEREVTYLKSLPPDERALYFDFFDNVIARDWPTEIPHLTALKARVSHGS